MTAPTRVAIATCSRFPDLHPTELPALEAFQRAGAAPRAVVWDDPSVDWASFDCVVVRSIWGYHQKATDYFRWLDTLEKAKVRVHNPLPILRWNADKRYLLDLEKAGVPIVPSILMEPIRENVARLSWKKFVLKPLVSADAHHTFVLENPGAEELSAKLASYSAGMPILAQPFLPAVHEEGEFSLYYFGGEFSHAVVKRPASGDFRVQENHGGSTRPADATAAMREVAEAALAASEKKCGETLLTARVDLLRDGNRYVVGELELIEPALYFAHSPHGAKVFFDAVARLPIR